MKKKGFLNLKLISIIVAIVIFVIPTFFYVKKLLHKQELQNLSTVMLQIQAKVKVINEKNKLNNTNEYIGKDVTKEDLKKLDIEDDQMQKIKKIDSNDLEQLDIKDTIKNKNFVVNYDNEEIYCINGYKTENDKMVYSLTDINKLAVD